MEAFLSRKNFLFLLWEMERVLIRNMKHDGRMNPMHCSRFVLNFVSSRAVVGISFSIFCPRISCHLPQGKSTSSGTFANDLIVYLFN